MEPYDNFSYDKCTCSKLACQLLDKRTCHINIVICKIARVDGLAIILTSFTKFQTSKPSRQLMSILMAVSRMFESSQITSILLEALQSHKSQWNSKSERRKE